MNPPPVKTRQVHLMGDGAPHLGRLAGVAGSAAAAARDAGRSRQQIPRSAAIGLAANPGDLVLRALAILAKEDEAGRARRVTNPSARSIP
jgi:hypothetical protein